MSRPNSSIQPGPSGSCGSVALRNQSRMSVSSPLVSPSTTSPASETNPQIAAAAVNAATSVVISIRWRTHWWMAWYCIGGFRGQWQGGLNVTG